MIDPWIALGVNMIVLGALGALLTYAQDEWHSAEWQDYAAAVLVMTIAAGCAAMLAWGLTRAWA